MPASCSPRFRARPPRACAGISSTAAPRRWRSPRRRVPTGGSTSSSSTRHASSSGSPPSCASSPASDLPLLRLPDWEVLPYDLFSPHPDITSERLRTLFELPAAAARLPDRHGRHAHAAPAAAPATCRAAPSSSPRAQSLALEPFRQRLSRGRLRERQPGGEPRGVRGARLAARRVPDGQHGAAAHRPVRRRDRGHPALRPGDAALARCARHGAAAAGARGAARCRRRARVPPPLSHALRGRPDQDHHLPRRERGPGAGGHRVLPAAVLRRDGDAVRLPAARRRDRARRGAARGRCEQGLAGHRRRATRIAATTSSARCWRRRSCSSSPEQLDGRLRGVRLRHARCLQGGHRARRASACGAQLPDHRPARAAARCARRAAVRAARCFPARLRRARAARGGLRRAGAKCCRRCCARTATSVAAGARLGGLRRRRGARSR